jgi:hypothetical protein
MGDRNRGFTMKDMKGMKVKGREDYSRIGLPVALEFLITHALDILENG